MNKYLQRFTLVVAVVATATVLASGAAGAANGGRPFHVVLSGANEVPSNPHGDADRGSITLTLNPGQEEVCWSFGAITLTAGEPLPTAGHIHEAPADKAGRPVVTLFGAAPAPPSSYPTGTTCVTADRALIIDILQDPSAYYVNLHNATHPDGVMRGQLG